jgi:hypothetical protein
VVSDSRYVVDALSNPANELVDELAQSAARGVPGPTEQDVIAALKASAILAG